MTNLEKKTGTILIVDDDSLLRDWLTDVLGDVGYTTRAASDGRAVAPELRRVPVDLLITDLVMPGQEGIETIQAIRREFPQVKILAMSGANSTYLKMANALGANASVQKPFTAEEIVLAVSRLIG